MPFYLGNFQSVAVGFDSVGTRKIANIKINLTDPGGDSGPFSSKNIMQRHTHRLHNCLCAKTVHIVQTKEM